MVTKIYKNPERNKPQEFKPYVPQYQMHDIEPMVYKPASTVEPKRMVKPSDLHTAANKVRPISQPYAVPTQSPLGKGPVPNVGNNMEHTWSSVDGEFDQESADPSQEMVDNNLFVSDASLGFENGITAEQLTNNKMYPATIEADNNPVIQSNSNPEDLFSILTELDVDAYLLIVNGVAVCSGPKIEIEEQARLFAFGEHPMCDGQPVSLDEILILHKSKIKVGLFLE